MTTGEKKAIYGKLAALLKKYAKGGLVLKRGTIGGTPTTKRQLHLYGKKEVAILHLPKRQTYVAGIIEQKHFVGFYSMPMYSHAKQIPLKHPALKKARKGKSCINLITLDTAMLRELDAQVKRGIALYRAEGWI